MRALITFLCCFIIIFGLLMYANNKTWSTEDYLNSLQFDERPATPSLTNPDGTGVADEQGFWNKASAFFVFIWDCVCYPFELIIWAFNCVTKIVGGLF